MPRNKHQQIWVAVREEERRALALLSKDLFLDAAFHLKNILLLNPKHADAYYLLSMVERRAPRTGCSENRSDAKTKEKADTADPLMVTTGKEMSRKYLEVSLTLNGKEPDIYDWKLSKFQANQFKKDKAMIDRFCERSSHLSHRESQLQSGNLKAVLSFYCNTSTRLAEAGDISGGRGLFNAYCEYFHESKGEREEMNREVNNNMQIAMNMYDLGFYEQGLEVLEFIL